MTDHAGGRAAAHNAAFVAVDNIGELEEALAAARLTAKAGRPRRILANAEAKVAKQRAHLAAAEAELARLRAEG